MKRASKQAQSAVAKVATYRKSKADAQKSAPAGANRPNPRRGDDRVVVKGDKPKKAKGPIAARTKAVVEEGKQKAKEKIAAAQARRAQKEREERQARADRARANRAERQQMSGRPAVQKQQAPAPARPEGPKGPVRAPRPAAPAGIGRTAPKRQAPSPNAGYNPGRKEQY
jgi:hypothetical protein